MIKISVVVCTYNRSELLKRCLDSLVGQNVDPDLYEVLTVDNNSTDNTGDIAQEYCKNNSNFRYVVEKEQGHSQSRNRGWKEAKGELVAYIDDDAYADENWIKIILEDMAEHSPDVIGGTIKPYFENDLAVPKWMDDAFFRYSFGDVPRFISYPEMGFGFSSGNVVFKKSVLEETKGFSLKFGMVNGKLIMGEDSDLGYRLLKKKKLFYYEPRAIVYHLVSERLLTFKGSAKRNWESGKGMGVLVKIHFGLFKLLKKLVFLAFYMIFAPFLMTAFIFHRNKISFNFIMNFIYNAGVIYGWFLKS
jgi:glucosyl-dolichyl phosphate glucuronosyltransferase